MKGDIYKLENGLTIPDLHADGVHEALGVFRTYESNDSIDAMARAIHAYRAWDLRREPEERPRARYESPFARKDWR